MPIYHQLMTSMGKKAFCENDYENYAPANNQLTHILIQVYGKVGVWRVNSTLFKGYYQLSLKSEKCTELVMDDDDLHEITKVLAYRAWEVSQYKPQSDIAPSVSFEIEYLPKINELIWR